MEIKTLKTNPPVRMYNKTSNPLLFTFDLSSLIDNMKNSHSWAKGELISMILSKSYNKQVVLTALREGTEIESFQSGDSITIQIIEGKLSFHSRKESVTLNKGQLLTIHENIKYSLTILEETVFILTIANSRLKVA